MEDEDEIKIEYNENFEQDPLSESSNTPNLLEDASLSEIHEGLYDVEDCIINENVIQKTQAYSKVAQQQSTVKAKKLWYKSIDSKGRYECQFCSRKYSTVQNVRRHTLSEHPAQASVFKDKIAKIYPSFNKCHICKRKFRILADLQNHLKAIHPNVKNQCHKCQAMFVDEESLFNHLASIHELHGSNIYVCLFCCYRTNKISHFHQHQRIHLQSKNHKCDHCDYATNNKPNLRIHERIHEKTKPYKCKFIDCGYSSATRSALRSHELTHDKEKHYIYCDKCIYKTLYKQSLRRHMDSHNRSTIKPIL